MKELNLNEIHQVAGAAFGLFEGINMVAGGLVGAAAMSQLAPVNIALTGIVVTAPYLAIAGGLLGATFGYAISHCVH